MMMPGPPGGALISVQEALGLGPEPPKPLTAEEAEAAAEAENLTLALSDKSATGFKCVGKIKNGRARPYVARAYCNGNELALGCFATPQEAALVIARRAAEEGVATPLCQALAEEGMATPAATLAPKKPMSPEEAEAAAEVEGLTLELSDKNATGFKGVSEFKGRSRPYRATVRCEGGDLVLGCFATPQEAALVIARRHRRAEARAASDGTRGEKECPICLETLEPSTGGLVKTACPGGGHIFHRSCLYRCFGDGCTADCPMCRRPVNKGDETPLPRPDETPPKQRRLSCFTSREMAGMADLVLTRPKREAPSEGGPSKRARSTTTSAVAVRQAVGALPRQSLRVCMRMGLPTEHTVR
ncbi:hypothetical protein EMIHUDRAFT_224297 [Emiliania huxleyi CCMP1516]|uniref:RING-type domain-containing protein n=2 Tax=Emiliania huxleyi TaxID=2903 RepID=A0A0D3KS13_EMIH1|nr:hypothetical protein EMIHUDRAFT_221881 [Emiliania huxleyi CCMP1516]XP_005790977.1 hypothetical protein EMIHUDRAFT_224297 [Emiliania huxleyi CCMP1516]EOD03731.1 hypothetical protein EMIHUDRAFT_221881 [Emiliania huxleyi CCMP1516]EOD38548.1 hypothetical protein EMIHUDRAFT_224297 [Emiliania huxleyi CCMP1516]|eukprot:XP_005756160.1 hypothetical protein EMIHUDRAFT_221881 [Emiliania huxleyi CCMP1516]